MGQLKKILIIVFTCTLMISVAFGQVDLSSGLIAHFPMNGNANEIINQDKQGTVNNAELAADRFGKEESCYFFDETKKAYIAGMTDETLPDGSSPRTLSAWIKTPSNGNGGFVVFDYGKMANNMDCSLCYIKKKVVLSFWANDIWGSIDINDDQWHLILAAWDGTTVSIYVDGELDASQTPDQIPNTTLGGSLTIGVTNNKLWHHFNGLIDDIRIYNRALSQGEVKSLYESATSGIMNKQNKLINDFQLYPNYPNPFNPTTSIRYTLAKPGEVTLKVYNLMGKEIVTLVDGMQSVGNYDILFHGDNLASGVYVYELMEGNHSMRRKMQLMK